MTSIPPPPAPPDDPWQAASPVVAPATGNATWKPWTAAAVLLLWFTVTIFFTIVIAIVAGAMGYAMKDPPPGVNIAGTFAQDIAMIGAVLVFAHLAGRPRGADLGLLRPAIGTAIATALGVWLGFLAFSLVWKAAISLDEPQALPDELGINGSSLNLVLAVITIAVLAPLAEELLFRGYIFRSLRNWKGFAPAAVITGLIFGAVHIGSSPIGYTVPLALFGFGLCLLYERTGSLYPCIALHALNNSLALGIDQKWTWEIPFVMVGSMTAALACAALLARVLRDRADRAPGRELPAVLS